MSLFENDQFRWRETYFVLFNEEHRPSVAKVKKSLGELGKRFELTEIRGDDEERFDSLTLLAAEDYAGIDVSYVTGEEVAEQIANLQTELKTSPLDKEEKAKYLRLGECNARYDVYHFEQVVLVDEEEDEFIDPGALLLVLEKLARLCHGVGVDPQSGSLL